MRLGKRDKLEENFLVTDISPRFTEQGEKTIEECFREEMKKADKVEISVAYCSCGALRALDQLVERGNIKFVCLILGMYRFIGFSENLHQLVLSINEKWERSGKGEIRLTHSFKHHGKLYCFYKNNQIVSVMVGSPNLSFLIEGEKISPKQYEIALLTHIPSNLESFRQHIEKLKSENFSKNVAFLERYKSIKKRKFQSRKQVTIITYTKIP